MMLTYQPLFIGGIDDVKVATDSAYGGMAAYIFTFLLCVVYQIKAAITGEGGDDDIDAMTRRRSGNEYSGVPQSTGAVNDFEMSLDLPPSVEEGRFS